MSNLNVWSEDDRPEKLDDVVGQPAVAVLKAFVACKNVVDITLVGPPGVGKTSAVVAMAKELYGMEEDQYGVSYFSSNFTQLNASDERGIEVVRTTIKDFTTEAPTHPDVRFKTIFLDEADALCLQKGTEILTGYPSSKKKMKIEDVPVDKYIPMPSLNIETRKIENDRGKLVISGEVEYFKMTLENGKEIIASPKHPFFCLVNGKIVEVKLKDLKPNMKILDFEEELNIKKCEVCGSWTTKKNFCSMDCKNKGHSNRMQGNNNPAAGKPAWNNGLTKEDDERVAKQACTDNNCSKRPEVKEMRRAHQIKQWKDPIYRENITKKLSEVHAGKSWEEWHINLTPEQLEERRKQSSSSYRETGIYKNSTYREKMVAGLTEVECAKCHEMIKVGGIDGIYVHHKDGDHSHNVEENLEFNCPKCHNLESHDVMTTCLEKGWEIIRGPLVEKQNLSPAVSVLGEN
jgi:replication factor C small subunit